MASSTIRNAIGVVKDQTSISLAKFHGNVAPDLEVLIVKATSHYNEPTEEKYIREILNLTSHSKTYVNACIYTLLKRLNKTHDWIVALKALILIHRLLVGMDPAFGQEMIYVNRKGTRVLDMSDFHDEAHSNSWEHSGFVKTYAMFLDRKLEFMAFEHNISSFNNSLHFKDVYKDLNGDSTDKVLERLHHLLRVLDRVISCRPTGNAKNSRIVLVALYVVLEESVRVYGDMCEMLEVLLEWFPHMEYDIGVKVFDQFVYAAKLSDELVGFYNWCKDIGVCKSLEFTSVQKISDELLGGLETCLSEKKNVYDNGSEGLTCMNEIEALLTSERNNPPPPPPPPATMPPPLMDLEDDAMSADAYGNKLTLSLFCLPPSVATDGTLELVGTEDPFAASLTVPPPLYVQIADMEKKQNLLLQEQQIWEKKLAKIIGGYGGMGQQMGYYDYAR